MASSLPGRSKWRSEDFPRAKDAEDAIVYLRKQGKTEGQIRAWLLLQKARFNFGVKG